MSDIEELALCAIDYSKFLFVELARDISPNRTMKLTKEGLSVEEISFVYEKWKTYYPKPHSRGISNHPRQEEFHNLIHRCFCYGINSGGIDSEQDSENIKAYAEIMLLETQATKGAKKHKRSERLEDIKHTEKRTRDLAEGNFEDQRSKRFHNKTFGLDLIQLRSKAFQTSYTLKVTDALRRESNTKLITRFQNFLESNQIAVLRNNKQGLTKAIPDGFQIILDHPCSEIAKQWRQEIIDEKCLERKQELILSAKSFDGLEIPFLLEGEEIFELVIHDNLSNNQHIELFCKWLSSWRKSPKPQSVREWSVKPCEDWLKALKRRLECLDKGRDSDLSPDENADAQKAVCVMFSLLEILEDSRV